MDGKALFEANDFLWKRNASLEAENRQWRQEVQHLRRQRQQQLEQLQALRLEADRLHQQLATLQQANASLQQRVKELSGPDAAAAVPPWVKANVPRRRRKKPGRKPGHPAALRPLPARIDTHQQVPLPLDPGGQASCPACGTQLSDLQEHQRLVEELLPARPQTLCYHTTSGWCPCCRKRVESRAAEQPPASDLPHGQLGLNALATAGLLRVRYRLPFRQITDLLVALTGLRISPAALARQIQRLGCWLREDRQQVQLALRAAAAVHADETGWRTNGHNGYLWTLCNDRHTLYHIDRSRGGTVIRSLLGEGFGADGHQTLISDFYGVYDQLAGSQQKCLAHLLRELHQTQQRRAELKGHRFFGGCRRVLKAMLKLKAEQGRAPPAEYVARVRRLEKRLERLAAEGWDDADADRLAARLRKHCGKLGTFLHRPEVPGTNNAAERALRPAVVMRKITGGSRSDQGAQAWAILASVLKTAQQQQRPLLDTLKALIQAHWSGQRLPLLTSDPTPAAGR